jgi:hypothetical protein
MVLEINEYFQIFTKKIDNFSYILQKLINFFAIRIEWGVLIRNIFRKSA